MITVVCILLIHIETAGKDFWTNKEMRGTVIEERGDSWLIDFGARVELVNSNLCLRSAK